MRVYFDNAASAPILPEVVEVMRDALIQYPGNPSAIHYHGRSARAAIEKARKSIARSLGAATGEIFFTSGGTEANNTILKSLVLHGGIRRVITTPLEHPCVRKTLAQLANAHPLEVVLLAVNDEGHIDLSDLERSLNQSEAPALVCLMHGNNEIGTMHPMEEISALCRGAGQTLMSDTVQTIGHYPIQLEASGIAFASASAHKFHGPKGIGFMYVRQGQHLEPFMTGGAQERNLRAGTENLAGIMGMAKALDMSMAAMNEAHDHLIDLKGYARRGIQEVLPMATFNGCSERALKTVLSVSFPEAVASDLLVMQLDIEGVSVSGGSACSSGAQQASLVMGTLRPGSTDVTLRLSFSRLNTKQEVDFLIEKLRKILVK